MREENGWLTDVGHNSWWHIKLNYGCEGWGFHKAPNVERVHLNFCKKILQVKRTTQNDFIYGELGRYPMFVCRQIRIIRYWLNIVSGRKAPYVCALYHTQLSIVNNGQKKMGESSSTSTVAMWLWESMVQPGSRRYGNIYKFVQTKSLWYL